MSFTIVANSVPLLVNPEGVVLVGQTRVPLETVIASYKQGFTAEEIAEQFPALDLADIYAVISYYLRHQDAVEAYMQEQQQRSEQVRAENQQRFPSQGLRERLLARRAGSSR